MFCLLLYETVVHNTDRVLIDRKTIKHFVNEYEKKWLQERISYINN
jgi:hypothetical protein